MSVCLPVSFATSNIFSSFTRKGLKLIVCLFEGNFNSYFDEFIIGRLIIFHSCYHYCPNIISAAVPAPARTFGFAPDLPNTSSNIPFALTILYFPPV